MFLIDVQARLCAIHVQQGLLLDGHESPSVKRPPFQLKCECDATQTWRNHQPPCNACIIQNHRCVCKACFNASGPAGPPLLHAL